MSVAIALTDQSLDQYMTEIRKVPTLTRDQELLLANRYRDFGDLSAAHHLVLANLRFVVKIAHEYKNYGFRLLDLVQEGNIGLMMAVKKYDPTKGYRLISYAVFWIRAQINSFIMRSWSLVKLGTGQARRKLFFKLRSQKALLAGKHAPGSEMNEAVAETLDVDSSEVAEMDQRLAARDFSLDAQLGEDSTSATHLDLLASEQANQEELLANHQETEQVKEKVNAILNDLNDKERYIVEHRLMNHEPQTLQEIGDNFKVSRERVRQLENRVISKLREKLLPQKALIGAVP